MLLCDQPLEAIGQYRTSNIGLLKYWLNLTNDQLLIMECEDIDNNLLTNILTHYYMPHLINYSIVITIETTAPAVKYCTTCEQIYTTSVNSKILHYNRILL